MGTFSIWHWVIVLLVILILFGLPSLAVYRENSSERLLRIGFLKWIGIYVGIPILFSFVAGLLQQALAASPCFPSRVWTQLIHNLMAKMWTMARKFRLSFSKRVASLRMSFMVQKKRSTMLRIL